jgi:putative DNA primase/helicase
VSTLTGKVSVPRRIETMQSVLTPLEIDQLPIPTSLRQLRQWGVWRYVEVDGKPKKRPFYCTGFPASTTQPDKWGTFEQAAATYAQDGYAGIGFVFTSTDPNLGVDLDHCVDSELGILEPWAAQIVRRLDSYTEYSPSGTGVHTIVEATLPGTGRKLSPIEMYDRGRYFTITGKRLESTPATVNKRHEVATALYTAMPIIARLLGDADKRAKFEPLFVGDTGGHGDDHSTADLALCSMAAWAGATDDQIDALVRLSGLYREKWERPDYRQMTINKARTKTGEAPQSGERNTPQVGGGNRFLKAAIRGTDLMAKEFPEPVYTLKPILRQGKLAMFHGPAGTNKSWIVLDLAIAVASGTQWANFPATEGVAVVISLELTEAELRERAEKQLTVRFENDQAAKERALSHLVFLGEDSLEDGLPRLIDEVDALIGLIQEYHAALIVFDPLNRLHQADDSSAKEMTPVLASFDQMRRKTDCIVLFVHHDSKSGGGGDHKNASRGTGRFNQDPQLVVHIQKVNDDTRKVTFGKVNGGKTPEPVLFEETQDTTFGGAVRYREGTVQTNEVRLLAAITNNPGEGKGRLCELSGVPDGSFSKAVKALRESGQVELRDSKYYPASRKECEG